MERNSKKKLEKLLLAIKRVLLIILPNTISIALSLKPRREFSLWVQSKKEFILLSGEMALKPGPVSVCSHYCWSQSKV